MRRHTVKSFISAIQFITILRVGRPGTFDPRRMIPFFPLVGLLLGLLVAGFDRLARCLWTEPVAALLDVTFLAILTGAFHLDGLGDTADGLCGHRPKDKVLAIMKDSRIGVMGLVAIVLGLALKWGGIMGLEAHRSLLLILVPAYARSGMLFGLRIFDYGRPEGGTGRAFFSEKLKISAFWGVLVPVTISLFLGWKGIWLNLFFAVILTAILWYYKQRLGCITGDMLGAMTEMMESGLFLLISSRGLLC
ncbi:MAG: adenosylcobinamide-GDP ribazoletransferase [Desulfobacterales bacterium]|nr:MAG: adenosylcobinamide-GDP ribazoletransferase [Desulfobacterales bacterium]